MDGKIKEEKKLFILMGNFQMETRCLFEHFIIQLHFIIQIAHFSFFKTIRFSFKFVSIYFYSVRLLRWIMEQYVSCTKPSWT